MKNDLPRLLPLVALVALPAPAQEWKIVPGHITTEWAAKVDPKNPLPDYPRPQLVRDKWTNLNGLWDYAIVGKDEAQPAQFAGKILVPFPVESALSGVKKPVSAAQRLWYRRSFAAPAMKAGERLLLHFGAVDWEAHVLLNGREVVAHKGGYAPFSADITDAIKAGDNELVVSVWDSHGANGAPRGKQDFGSIARPAGIMYTPCTGIWQTVWLETVPAAYVSAIKLTPDIDKEELRLTVTAGGAAGDVEITALAGGKEVAKITGKSGTELALPVKKPRLWTPDDPFLYDLKIKLGGDEVRSYFGMRKIALGKDEKGVLRPLLNGKFVFQSGPLDQGYWPDGIYTAPTDAALKYDLDITKRLGFNMVRKHVKVEPARWYYWADKLGLLVWQDMPSGGGGGGGNKEKDGVANPERAPQFEAELKEMLAALHNNPSIVMWVVFNEGWGQYDTKRITEWTKQTDPSRLVSNASGWDDRGVGDVNDMHNYPGPGSPPREENRIAVLGEFGGLGLPVNEHKWVEATWGYRNMPDAKTLTKRIVDLWRGVFQLRDDKGLCAAVYTQTTDVETESNGLLTYDRKVLKVDEKQVFNAISKGQFPTETKYVAVLPTAREEKGIWRFTTEKPVGDWFMPDFVDEKFQKGQGGFGAPGTPGSVIGTEWRSPDIWLRRDFTLPEGKVEDIVFRLHHDEDVEIYLNGVLAFRANGYSTDYEEFPLNKEALAALKPGKNIIALHCHQTGGGQYVDVGIFRAVGGK